MAIELTMPRLAMSMTEGNLAQWMAPDGATVQEGQVIYAIESDKAVEEINAPASGRLTQLAVAGGTYPVGAKLGEIL